jgi:hypothetical protein
MRGARQGTATVAMKNARFPPDNVDVFEVLGSLDLPDLSPFCFDSAALFLNFLPAQNQMFLTTDFSALPSTQDSRRTGFGGG